MVIDVWLSDYGNSEFQTISGHTLKTTLKMDVEALGINLAILHPVEILKLYLKGCFQSNVEERYADYLIGILTRHCYAEGVLNRAINPTWKFSDTSITNEVSENGNAG